MNIKSLLFYIYLLRVEGLCFVMHLELFPFDTVVIVPCVDFIKTVLSGLCHV